jgi:hypothetical protein
LEFGTPYVESPVFSGYISMLVRNLPFRIHEVQNVLDEGIQKELVASQEKYHPQTFNYASFLSSSKEIRHSTPLSPGFLVRPEVHDLLYYGFEHAIQRIETSLLYPDYSNKTIGVEATRNLRCAVDGMEFEDYVENTTRGLEILYCRSGWKVKGRTEARWAWKFNDLKPRVYYARGPDQYYNSRYVQAIFNIFVDAFEFCHRFRRFDHNHLRFPVSATAFIYDYESFTSKLWEIRNFTRELAEKCRGRTVRIVDTYEGVITADLGELLEEFNVACNIFPEFDIGKLNWDRFYEEEVLIHNCGMLGVPGNISSCTLLHGIHLVCLLRTLIIKVIGDDAFGILENPDLEDEVIEELGNIGRVSKEKVELWRPDKTNFGDIRDGWHYTKRPISRLETRVHVGRQMNFPPIMICLGLPDPFHTMPIRGTDSKFARKVASISTSFSRQAASIIASEEEQEFCERFLYAITHMSGVDKICRSLPYTVMYSTRVDGGYLEDMIHRHWYSVISVPEEFVKAPVRIEREAEIESKMTRSIKLAMDMGYADCTPRFVDRFARDCLDLLGRIISGRFTALYDVYLHDACPDWLLVLVDSESSVPDGAPDDIIDFGGLDNDQM